MGQDGGVTAEDFAQFAARIDAQTPADLLAKGSMKWADGDGLAAWVAEMDLGIAPEIKVALQSALDKDLIGYVPAANRTELCEAAAGFQADRYGWQVSPDRVGWLPDILSGLGLMLNHLMPQAKKLAVLTPCYMPFLEMPGRFSRELVQVPMVRGEDEWRVDYPALNRAFAEGVDLLVFANPHNPIGKVYRTEELATISEIVESHGARVFSDEIHAPITFSGARHVPYASVSEMAARHSLTAISASKAYSTAGLKCAQLVMTNDVDLAFVRESGHGIPYESSILGVFASIAAYRDAQPWLDNALRYLEGNRDLVSQRVATWPGVRYLAPEGTYLAWLDMKQLGLDEPPAEMLAREAGVIMNDGAACGDSGRGCVRLNFATPTPVLTEMLDRIGAAVGH